jgi:hypothetical protein
MHGWQLRVLPNVTDEQLAALLGTDRHGDFQPHEGEEPDLIAVVSPLPPRARQQAVVRPFIVATLLPLLDRGLLVVCRPVD